jgi:hypothetical protein
LVSSAMRSRISASQPSQFTMPQSIGTLVARLKASPPVRWSVRSQIRWVAP